MESDCLGAVFMSTTTSASGMNSTLVLVLLKSPEVTGRPHL